MDKQFALIGGKRIVFPVRLQEINLLLLYIEMAIQISAQLPVLKKNYQPSVREAIIKKRVQAIEHQRTFQPMIRFLSAFLY